MFANPIFYLLHDDSIYIYISIVYILYYIYHIIYIYCITCILYIYVLYIIYIIPATHPVLLLPNHGGNDLRHDDAADRTKDLRPKAVELAFGNQAHIDLITLLETLPCREALEG